MQVDFGELVDCASAPAGAPTVELDVAFGDGEPMPMLATVEPGPLDEIRDRECAQRRVDESIGIAFSSSPVIDGSMMRTSLDVIRRAGDEPIRIESVRGSVIIAIRPDRETDPLLTIAPAHHSASIPLLIFISSCVIRTPSVRAH